MGVNFSVPVEPVSIDADIESIVAYPSVVTLTDFVFVTRLLVFVTRTLIVYVVAGDNPVIDFDALVPLVVENDTHDDEDVN